MPAEWYERPTKVHFTDGRKAPITYPRSMKLNARTGEGDYGDTNEVSGHIRINGKLDEQEKAAALLHEFLHHVAVSMNLRGEDREDWVQAMEFQLRGLIRSNKEAFYWIISNL